MTTPTLNDRRNLIASLLGDCLDAAPEEKRNALAQAIEDYTKAVGPARWATIQKQMPAVGAEMLDVIIERTDARPGEQS